MQVIDEDEMSMTQLVKHQKMQQSQSQHMAIVKDAKYANTEQYQNDNADKLAKSNTHSYNVDTPRLTQRQQNQLDKCWYCTSDNKPQVEILSFGYRVYLCKPPRNSTATCLIVPVEHHKSLTECSQDEWDEIDNYRKSMLRAFHAQDYGVVFVEQSANKLRHAVMECYAMPYGAYDTVPMHFKQAIMSQAYDWSQHQPIIDTSKSGYKFPANA